MELSTAWRRRATDPRVVDVALVVASLALTVLAVKTPWATIPRPAIAVVGVAASAHLLLWRRRPVATTAVGAVAHVLTGSPFPLLVGLVASGLLRRRGTLVAAGVLGVAGWGAPTWLNDGIGATSVAGAAAATAFLLVAGAYLGARAALIESLRNQAAQADAERALRDEAARAGERSRIAREMHDVLAHKVSLIALHAGALEVNAGVGAERVEQGAALIRSTAHEALEELRLVLGLLRSEPGSDDGPFTDLDHLVSDWRRAGVRAELRDEVVDLPAPLARAAYRVVQEGLTNAARHAPGAPVIVSVTGQPGSEVTITIRDEGSGAEAGQTDARGVPGAGLGLVGLRERVTLIGGTLYSGCAEGGGWVLEARMPWNADVPAPMATRA